MKLQASARKRFVYCIHNYDLHIDYYNYIYNLDISCLMHILHV